MSKTLLGICRFIADYLDLVSRTRVENITYRLCVYVGGGVVVVVVRRACVHVFDSCPIFW